MAHPCVLDVGIFFVAVLRRRKVHNRYGKVPLGVSGNFRCGGERAFGVAPTLSPGFRGERVDGSVSTRHAQAEAGNGSLLPAAVPEHECGAAVKARGPEKRSGQNSARQRRARMAYPNALVRVRKLILGHSGASGIKGNRKKRVFLVV